MWAFWHRILCFLVFFIPRAWFSEEKRTLVTLIVNIWRTLTIRQVLLLVWHNFSLFNELIVFIWLMRNYRVYLVPLPFPEPPHCPPILALSRQLFLPLCTSAILNLYSSAWNLYPVLSHLFYSLGDTSTVYSISFIAFSKILINIFNFQKLSFVLEFPFSHSILNPSCEDTY